ncbi:MAG: hypothetical protein BGP12_22575 [Rhodospirillales bacterium 70-18]|nr:YdcF family protein [Rhodospirillales bacterium]OJY70506.1 MAG: hypothetical protein BGP12_22575 [Rhodospirillales bacterium 70-18]
MSLAALPTALLIPPVNLLPLTVAGLLLARWHPRAGRLVAALGLLGLFVFALPATAALLMASLERGLPPPPPGAGKPQAVVILSAEARTGLPGGIIQGDDAGPLTLERMRAGARLARAQGLPVLVSGGVVRRGHESLAAMMARVLSRDFDTPTRWVEDRSLDTWQNAQFSAALLRRDGISSVYLVSHGWHLRRAIIAFRHFGIAVTPAPVRIAPWPEDWLEALIPEAGAWQRSYWAMHEWIGCLVYALRA